LLQALNTASMLVAADLTALSSATPKIFFEAASRSRPSASVSTSKMRVRVSAFARRLFFQLAASFSVTSSSLKSPLKPGR
jgi:hypothetical protein